MFERLSRFCEFYDNDDQEADEYSGNFDFDKSDRCKFLGNCVGLVDGYITIACEGHANHPEFKQLVPEAQGDLRSYVTGFVKINGRDLKIASYEIIRKELQKEIDALESYSGWVKGPPTELGMCGIHYENGNYDAVKVCQADLDQGTRCWLHDVKEHFRIPERTPPKPVVDCCFFGRDNIKLVNGQWDMTITVEHPGGSLKTYSLTPKRCICDTELPKLNQGE